jgi:phosphatidylserine decarboxylase
LKLIRDKDGIRGTSANRLRLPNHANRIICRAKIKDRGAARKKCSLDNEQNAIVMRTAAGRGLAFVQIAGFLARRIVCCVKPGDRCRRGERVGMIKLGSRVDVFIPGNVDLSVKLGDRVRAGETVLGVLR